MLHNHIKLLLYKQLGNANLCTHPVHSQRYRTIRMYGRKEAIKRQSRERERKVKEIVDNHSKRHQLQLYQEQEIDDNETTALTRQRRELLMGYFLLHVAGSEFLSVRYISLYMSIRALKSSSAHAITHSNKDTASSRAASQLSQPLRIQFTDRAHALSLLSVCSFLMLSFEEREHFSEFLSTQPVGSRKG